MSLKTKLVTAYLARRTSPKRCEAIRRKEEKRRRRAGDAHIVHYFHQVDDPYSILAAKALKPLARRYDISLKIHIVGPPSQSAVPEPEKLSNYSCIDAVLLAGKFALTYPEPLRMPDPSSVKKANAILVQAIDAGIILDVIEDVSDALWSGKDLPELPAASAAGSDSHMKHAARIRKKAGHYLGAVFCYGGECYWGLDRLHYLENRLKSLGATLVESADLLYPPLSAACTVLPKSDQPIDFFVSLRSPYTAIVARRVFELGKRTGVPVRIRGVLPMVMRGLPVAREKQLYIVDDVAREARRLRIPFGRICDPVGRPTERGLALLPLAEKTGQAEAYLLSFLEGVWAQGIDAGTDKGLQKIAERAGLDWAEAKVALGQEDWRKIAEENRKELFGYGLWGVPSFRYGDKVMWGQDRLWALEEVLQ